MRTTATALAIPAVFILLLAGCAAGSGGTDAGALPDGAEPTGATEDLDGGNDGAGCPFGVWSLDTTDLGTQLEAYLEESSGQENTVTMDGMQTLEWGADGAAEFSTALTVTILTSLDDGTEMTITQVHSGGSSGELAYADGEAIPSNWDGESYVVTSTVTIAGVPTESDTPIDGFFATSQPMQIGCDGGDLYTYTEPSFVTQRWVRQT